MRIGQIFVYGLAPVFLGFAFPSSAHAGDTFRKLKDAEIKTRLAGTEITDGVHWAEQYMRDGTYKVFHMVCPRRRAEP